MGPAVGGIAMVGLFIRGVNQGDNTSIIISVIAAGCLVAMWISSRKLLKNHIEKKEREQRQVAGR